MSIYNPPVAPIGEVATWNPASSTWTTETAILPAYVPPVPVGLPAGYTPLVADGEWYVIDGSTLEINTATALRLLAESSWTQIDGVANGLTNKAAFDTFRTNVYNILKVITAGDIEWPVMPTPTWS